MKTIHQAIEMFKLEVAILDYSGIRYIKDKQAIADSFEVRIWTDDVGGFVDLHNGRVWVVYKHKDGFRYSHAN